MNKHSLRVLLTLPLLLGLHCASAKGQTPPAASSTIDVCHDTVSGNWRYTGAVAVDGSALRSSSLVHVDYSVDNKTSLAGFQPALPAAPLQSFVSATGTRVHTFSMAATPLVLGSLRGSARILIADPLAAGTTPLSLSTEQEWMQAVCGCPKPTGCTRTQGYWKSKPGVVWPSPYKPDAPFFSSSLTWRQVLETPPQGGNGYLILAHQYIAALLNIASGASAPAGVRSVIERATTYFASGATPGSCGGSACATQKTWAGILDTYNNGLYPGAPAHCPD